MTNYNDGEWHRWAGEDMKPATIHRRTEVEYVWHDECSGLFGLGETAVGDPTNQDELFLLWENVLKFRVIKEHKEPREFWVNKYNDNITTSVPDYYDRKDYIHVRELL